ncbi:MAG: hypothetical protein CM15mP120_14470 [Pseudomonadota bacterium]|nr:MAG: hypothetical protein CM15mP120_14470 [Pseudomonadota bacterium]
MQTVGLTVVSNSTRRSNQRLADHLATINPLPTFVWTGGQVMVLFYLLKVEDLNNFVKGLHECAEKLRKSDVL